MRESCSVKFAIAVRDIRPHQPMFSTSSDELHLTKGDCANGNRKDGGRSCCLALPQDIRVIKRLDTWCPFNFDGIMGWT